MTVKHLIALLQNEDEEAEVRIMEQESYPFEYDLTGIVARADMATEYDWDPDMPERDMRDPVVFHTKDFDGTHHKDSIFLVAGKQLCSGNKNAWEACRR